MSERNPWHAKFDALCEEMCEHWSGIVQEMDHNRDETLYDPILFAEIRGEGVHVDISENAAASNADLLDSGGEARFLRISIFGSPDTILDLVRRSDGETANRRETSFRSTRDDRYRYRACDPVADGLVEDPRFWNLVERMEPFAVLRIGLLGCFLGRRIEDAEDLTLARVRPAVEALVDLSLMVHAWRPVPEGTARA